MSSLIAIDPVNHLNLQINPTQVVQHSKEQHLIPVVLSEFEHVALQYPLVITKNGESGQFLPVAMLGLSLSENLFLHDDQFNGLYVPLQLQRQPFFVGVDDEESAKSEQTGELVPYTVCFDPKSPTITGSEGERIYTDDGQETAFFQEAKQLLGQILEGEAANEQFINTLVELDLLQPLSIDIEYIDHSTQRINGLFGVDQAKFAQLSGDTLVALREQHFLKAIYAMIISLGHIYALIEKKNELLQAK